MKKTFTLAFLFITLMAWQQASAQVAYSPLVETLTEEITEETLMELENPLTGAIPTMVDGEEYTIATRHSYTEGNEKAGQWLYEKFEEFGYEPWFHEFGSNGENVLAQKTGTLYPDQQYIICGHYDDMPSGSLAPGADDNASGTVGVLEAARILAGYDTKYTVIFALWDQEEQGLIGSANYASDAADNGDNILGVINLDMIAWDSDDDFMCSITNNELSNDFTYDFVDIMNLYEPEMDNNFISTTASDHSSFWNEGYPALLLIEDMDDFNQYYHTTADDIDILNMPYFEKMARTAMAGISTFAFDYFVEMDHEPIASGPSTSGRYTELVVEDRESLDDDDNAPRLYYKTDDGEYTHTTAYDTDGDTLYYLIPGQSLGTAVHYYFAVQGDEGDFVATLPSGGRGVNPPGTEAPQEPYMYLVDEIYNNDYCSESVPVAIINEETVTDTIFIEDEGVIMDVDVMIDITHTYVGDLVISLKGPSGETVALSIANGSGGDNYSNTIFDDEADQSIINGTPPYEGSYQPQQPLSLFDEKDLDGPWVLQITDNHSMDDGTLQDWCLMMQYGPVSGVGMDTPVIATNALEIFPNPADRMLNLKTHFNHSTHARIAVYDMYGRKVNTIADRHFSKGNYSLTSNINMLAEGHYVVVMQTDFGKAAEKLIIKR